MLNSSNKMNKTNFAEPKFIE